MVRVSRDGTAPRYGYGPVRVGQILHRCKGVGKGVATNSGAGLGAVWSWHLEIDIQLDAQVEEAPGDASQVEKAVTG